MYLSHFGLDKKPFELIPDPYFLHLSKMHSVALSLLEYGIQEQTGITVISGEVGSGKTTLIHHILNQIDQNTLTIGLISNTHESLGELSHWIALAFGLSHEGKDKVSLYHDIHNFIIKEYASGRRVVLIVDEAQNLGRETLEELRLFTNLNTNQDFLLQIILVGQPELAKTLSSPELSQIAQRVSVEFHLEPLGWQDTKNYINHRLITAGASETLFDETAIAVIFYHTGGVPRLINTLCDYALVYGYAQDEKKITFKIAMEVIRGRKIGGVNRFIKIADQTEAIRLRIKHKLGIDIAGNNNWLPEDFRKNSVSS